MKRYLVPLFVTMSVVLGILLSVLLLTACQSSGPKKESAVTGVVVDNAGVPLPGVTVVVAGKTAVTDNNGEYRIENVPAGKQVVDAQLAGFVAATEEVSLHRGDVKKVKSVLRPRSVSEMITVTAAEAPPVDRTARAYAPPASKPSPTTPPGVAGGVGGGVVGGVSGGVIAGGLDVRKPQASYAHIVENDFIDSQKERTTTFSIDVDRAAYANVRHFLHANQMPPADAVRIEEMINYFPYHYPAPADGKPFAVSTEVAGCPWAPQHRLVRIGLQAKSVDAWKMLPNHLTFLLDVSGSMMPPPRLPLLKSAFRLLVDQLRAQDSVAVVVYAGAAGLVLPPTSGADKQTIDAALDKLQAGGSTAGGAGIELAYKTAQDSFDASGNNRVILATDGDFNVGVNDTKQLTDLISDYRKKGIYLSCIGVGDDNLNDALMESLADHGNGNYNYLDSMDEAKKVFVHEFGGTLVTVAKDVKVQLEFDPARVASYRQIGYEDRALANRDFEDDTKDAGEMGSGHGVTALYEIVPNGNTAGPIATLRVRYKDPNSDTSQLLTAPIVDEGKSAYAATPDTQFAAAVAEFGMLLRNSAHRGSATYADVAALARAMRGEDLEGWRDELLRMVDTSRALSGEEPPRVAGR